MKPARERAGRGWWRLQRVFSAAALSPPATPRRATRSQRAHTAPDTPHMPRDEESKEGAGVAAWLRRWWRALLSELLATATLVWLGIAAMTPLAASSPPLAHPAMAFGFMVVANACAFGPVSGAHMNPAVTLAALLYGQLAALPALGYVVAQMLGATLGFGALLATSPGAAVAPPLGVTAPGPGVSALAATLVEAGLTATLALACCGVWSSHDASRPDPSVPIKLGLVVAGLVYAGGFATGASLNPARSFGPALLQGSWDYQWVYWVGPLGGAALATLAHRFVLLPRPARRLHDTDSVALPLNDKSEQP